MPAGIGERARLEAEHFRLEQLARNGAAVDRHERVPAARRVELVNLVRGDLLAGAGVAEDQHRFLLARRQDDQGRGSPLA